MPTFNGDPNQPIYCTAGNLMDLMQMMLQNQQAAAEAAQRLATPTPRPGDSMKDELREYQKEVKYVLDTKTDDAWRVGILADAEVIGGTDILLKNQRESPATRPIEVDKWKIRSKALYRRMLPSLIGNVRTTIGALEADNAAALWDKINIEYGISLAEEHVNVFREFTRLQVRDNDYLSFQRRFRYLVARHKELCQGTEDVYHDLFLNGLREFQKTFVKSRLDNFYSTGQEPIVNIDLDDLMKQLTNRSSKKVGNEPKKHQPQADSATARKDEEKDKDAKVRKCTHCKKDGHTVDRCFTLHPELKRKKKDKKDEDKKDNKDDKKDDLMASQPSATAVIVKVGSYSTSTAPKGASKPWSLIRAPVLI
ncbi:hypothetical protein ACJ73_09989 [Blastomyces percursus]|uniref:Uncharacterized protein n=1 Tax=Blastomyces percursus TaxID=1658174 RepID=A0A1J9Q484_9EURO|nr:hypothetical protein ACJ73_09989 [Blastomyces percursus]